MATVTAWTCPQCDSDDTDINTWEAWCFDCDWSITKDSDPDQFQRLREAELARRNHEQRMDPQELRTIREYLGLTAEALAGILSVRTDTIHKWERGNDQIPLRVNEEVAAIQRFTAESVGQLVAGLQDARDPEVGVYTRDEDLHAARPDLNHVTARWWRHVVARTSHEIPGLQIYTAKK